MNKTIKELAVELTIEITAVCDTIKGRAVFVNQLLRSCSSIGANSYEAKYAQSTADFAVVLAYKHGNTIYGVGGWCGTETAYKQLYFVSITFSGDTWTLVDAGVQDVYTSGGIGAGTRLQLKEVIGVI